MGRLSLFAVGTRSAFAAMACCLACGPSFQAIYEGDARFEHCYAMDENATIPLQRKRDCWHDWTDRFTYGQTRDRVDYAVSRDRALALVGMPTDEALMQGAPGTSLTERLVAAPAPTSAFAPPPVVYQVDAGGPSASETVAPPVASPPPVAAPNADCSTACTSQWKACGLLVATSGGFVAGQDGGAPRKAPDTCERDFGKCMRYCFRDDGPKRRPNP